MTDDKYEVEYLKFLYENTFNEISDNSKEFSTFVAGNPNPLRIKVEDWLYENGGLIGLNFLDIQRDTTISIDRISAAYELDLLITDYIERSNL